jgi:hypothetical protein
MLSEKYVRTSREKKNTVYYVGFIGVPEKSKRGIIAKGGRRKLRVCLVWVLKFNKYCSTFNLFDKKFLILD